MHIAQLGPDLRLIVIQFLVPEKLVPSVIKPKRVSDTPKLQPLSGEEVLPSKSGSYLLHLLNGICRIDGRGIYELVDAWHERTGRPDGKFRVRYVFCHKEHVEKDKLFPDFIVKQDEIINSLANLLSNNLWATQGYLNPYFGIDGTPTGHKVLMLGCAGRVSTVNPDGTSVNIWSGGRDPITRKGRGRLVKLETSAGKLTVKDGKIFFEDSPLAGHLF